VKRNVQLIKNVSQQQFTNIESIIGNAVNMQGGEKSITSMIEENLPKINKRTRERAKFIAKDQLNKNLNALSIAKMESVGIQSYRWNHGNSREPRPWHISLAPNGLNKGVFSLDDPPIIDPKTGERGIPGQLINCSCFPTPVVEA
jgi:uncharacterized protein with gpF-like domain